MEGVHVATSLMDSPAVAMPDTDNKSSATTSTCFITHPYSRDMQTLPLDTSSWDLVLDSNGNLSLSGKDYSIAQDVASAIRTFKGECWYDVTLGLPYFQSVLGQYPPPSY